MLWRWPNAFEHPRAHHRPVHRAVVDALEPLVPPFERILRESHCRTRHTHVWIAMRPRADQPLARYLEPGQQTRDRVRVSVGPPTDYIYRAVNRREVLGNRSVLPIGVASRMSKPRRKEQRDIFQPLQPHVTPPRADQHGIGRLRD